MMTLMTQCQSQLHCASTKVFVCPQAKPLYCCLLPSLSYLYISIRNTVITQLQSLQDVLIYLHHPPLPRQEYQDSVPFVRKHYQSLDPA